MYLETELSCLCQKKKIPIEQRKQTVDTGTKDYKEYYQDFINENEVTKKCKYIQ